MKKSLTFLTILMLAVCNAKFAFLDTNSLRLLSVDKRTPVCSQPRSDAISTQRLEKLKICMQVNEIHSSCCSREIFAFNGKIKRFS